jgi:hypothetical protein
MASHPPRSGSSTPAAPQHFVPPTARELRAQAVQRLQAGLFGLAAIVLVVGLANIINDRARLADSGTTVAQAADDDAARSDPLAEAGVIPAASPEPAKGSGPEPKQ